MVTVEELLAIRLKFPFIYLNECRGLMMNYLLIYSKRYCYTIIYHYTLTKLLK